MTKNQHYSTISSKVVFIVLFAFITLIYLLSTIFTVSKSASNELKILINLQGEFLPSSIVSNTASIVFYTQTGEVLSLTDQPLTQQTQNTFELIVPTDTLLLNAPYALFIKPDKYIGQLFCSDTVVGEECLAPQIIIENGSNTLNFSSHLFYAGDLSPQDGKVNSTDLSQIIRDLGNSSSQTLLSDINGDLTVDTQDYALALYSLKLNKKDDTIPFSNLTQPSPTKKPTSQPTPSRAPSTAPSPTKNPQAGPGKCNFTLNGKVYITSLLINMCRIVDHEKHHACVNSEDECTQENTLRIAAEVTKNAISSCTGDLASYDSSKNEVMSTINSFEAGPCTPEPDPPCEDTRPQC